MAAWRVPLISRSSISLQRARLRDRSGVFGRHPRRKRESLNFSSAKYRADVAEGSGSIRSESLRAGQDDAGFPQLKGSDIASVDAATGEVLRFNATERVIERNILLALGRYA